MGVALNTDKIISYWVIQPNTKIDTDIVVRIKLTDIEIIHYDLKIIMSDNVLEIFTIALNNKDTGVAIREIKQAFDCLKILDGKTISFIFEVRNREFQNIFDHFYIDWSKGIKREIKDNIEKNKDKLIDVRLYFLDKNELDLFKKDC